MNTFLQDFLSYFFPNLATAPEWMHVYAGTLLLVLFVKLVLVVIERR